jgi:hypothetical protein
MSGVRTVYVEFGRDRVPLAWQGGRMLAEDETEAREDVQREFWDIAVGATVDRSFGDGLRAVRTGEVLLVETCLGAGAGRSRLDATVIVDRPVEVRWSRAAAQVADALHEGGVDADRQRLRASLSTAWRKTGSAGERLTAPFARLAANLRGGHR